MPLLATVLTSLISSLIARLLLGAGLTFITYEWVSDVLDTLITQSENSLRSLPNFALSFAKLWEIDECLSMIISTVELVIFINVARSMIGKK
jgi:hypothetical protein